MFLKFYIYLCMIKKFNIFEKIEWWQDGEFIEDENEEEEPLHDVELVVRKYQYTDSASYNGYRFWVFRLDNCSQMSDLFKFEFSGGAGNLRGYKKATDKEIELIKQDKIWFSNGFGVDSSGNFRRWKYSDMVKMVGEKNINLND